MECFRFSLFLLFSLLAFLYFWSLLDVGMFQMAISLYPQSLFAFNFGQGFQGGTYLLVLIIEVLQNGIELKGQFSLHLNQLNKNLLLANKQNKMMFINKTQPYPTQRLQYLIMIEGITFIVPLKYLSVIYLLLFQYFFVSEMQSGSKLHIALLRKISHLMPISNFRQRFNQSKQRKQLFRCNMTEEANCQDNHQSHSFLPLFDVNSRPTPASNKKIKSKQVLKEQNITISAWSIDEKDVTSSFQQTRYQKKLRRMTKDQTKKKRTLSFNTNLQLRKPLPGIQYCRSPSQEQSVKSKIDKEPTVRHKFSKIKQINLNLNKQNQLSALQGILLRDTIIRPSLQKISSYNAFVLQMKTQQRIKKLRN